MSVRSAIAVLAVLAFVGLLTYGLISKGSSGVEVGDVAPAPALPRLEGGGDGSLTEYKGRWVLVNFWASWCIPCRQEAPLLEEFQQRHHAQDFTVLGIDSRDLSDDGLNFVHRYGLSYPQLRDGNGDTAHDYGTTGVPESFLISPAGRVRLHLVGPVYRKYLDREVASLLPGGRS